jgi:hypothetical protein
MNITKDKDAEYCNLQFYEATGSYEGAFEAFIRVGKRLTEVKARLPHGQFMKWCEENLEFKHKWVTILMRANERYELSGYKDEPALSIQAYAENGSSTTNLEPTSEDNLVLPKEKVEKENKVKVLTKLDIFIQEYAKDDLEEIVLRKWMPLKKTIEKDFGLHGVNEAIAIMEQFKTFNL